MLENFIKHKSLISKECSGKSSDTPISAIQNRIQTVKLERYRIFYPKWALEFICNKDQNVRVEIAGEREHTVEAITIQ